MGITEVRFFNAATYNIETGVVTWDAGKFFPKYQNEINKAIENGSKTW